MKLASLVLISAVALTAQSRTRLYSSSVSSHGIFVHSETYLEPGSPSIQRHGGGVLTENGIIKSHIGNFDNQTYFGYDLTTERLADGRVRLRFAPLSIDPAKMAQLFPKVPSWRPLPLPGGPVTLVVKDGETVALDLFTDSSTGQKVTEYLTVHREDRAEARVEGPARDFGVEDATIALTAPKVSVDGKADVSWRGSISGSAVWMDLPSHGRFVFSLAARPELGMQRMGEVRGTSLAWRYAGRDYKISSSKPIASGSHAYHLYVFAIAKPVKEFTLFAGPRPDDPIRQRP